MKLLKGSHSELMKPYSHPGNGGHKMHQVRTTNPLQCLHFLSLSPNCFLFPVIVLGLVYPPHDVLTFSIAFSVSPFGVFLPALANLSAIHSSHFIYPLPGTCGCSLCTVSQSRLCFACIADVLPYLLCWVFQTEKKNYLRFYLVAPSY